MPFSHWFKKSTSPVVANPAAVGRSLAVGSLSKGSLTLKAVQPTTARTVSIAPSAENLPKKNYDDGVIRSQADFPRFSDLLSGPAALDPGLVVPIDIQDKIIAVQRSTTTAAIVFDPAFTTTVKPYLSALRAALTARDLQVEVMESTSELIASARQSAQSRQDSRSSSLGGQSKSIQLIREWLIETKASGGTDLHLQVVEGNKGLVLARIDGSLEPLKGQSGDAKGVYTDREVLLAITAAFENLSDRHSNNEGTFSPSKSMAAMLGSHLGIKNLRVRFASQRGFHGPKAVLRLLSSESSNKPMSFDSMGFSAEQQLLLEKTQRIEKGIILQMGVTGSGKTTVVNTWLETHPKNGSAAFYQIADPVEYLSSGVHYIYIQRALMTIAEAGMKDPYSEAIESIMRLDPDIVDIGEVRDVISARALANIGKSGHLALGTLHADSISGCINRLTDPKIGLTRQELTSGNLLAFMSYLALVPLLCKYCALDDHKLLISELGDSSDGRYLGSVMGTASERIGIGVKAFKFRNPSGCEKCSNRGVKGLTMCAEMMIPDDDWLDLSSAGRDREAIMNWRKKYSDKNPISGNTNGKLVIEHALHKAAHGLIDIRNVERFGQLDTLVLL